MSAFRITCPLCRRDFPVPAEVLQVNTATNLVTVQMDRTELYGHMQRCANEYGAPAPSASKVLVVRGQNMPTEQPAPSQRELAGRIGQMLDTGAYIATGGSRACTMCGMNGADCLTQLREAGQGTPCCAACGNGNTHPAPSDTVPCSDWGKPA